MLTLGHKAQILAEALPYLRSCQGKTFVIQFDGEAMADAALTNGFGRDVALLQLVGIRPVIVHGEGARIAGLLAQIGLPSTFHRGRRVIDEKTLNVVEMVLGEVNQEIVGLINRHGGRAVGLDGQDARFIHARRMQPPPADGAPEEADAGFVGDIVDIEPELLGLLQSSGFIPVVMPIGAGTDGQAFSVDASVLAGKLAATLGAQKLLLMTDAAGINDRKGRIVTAMSAADGEARLADGTVGGDLHAMLAVALEAVRHGVASAHIIDARVPNALLLEILTSEGVGTMVGSDEGPDFLADSKQYLALRRET